MCIGAFCRKSAFQVLKSSFKIVRLACYLMKLSIDESAFYAAKRAFNEFMQHFRFIVKSEAVKSAFNDEKSAFK